MRLLNVFYIPSFKSIESRAFLVVKNDNFIFYLNYKNNLANLKIIKGLNTVLSECTINISEVYVQCHVHLCRARKKCYPINY